VLLLGLLAPVESAYAFTWMFVPTPPACVHTNDAPLQPVAPFQLYRRARLASVPGLPSAAGGAFRSAPGRRRTETAGPVAQHVDEPNRLCAARLEHLSNERLT